jgi:hypothetical protein
MLDGTRHRLELLEYAKIIAANLVEVKFLFGSVDVRDG